MYDNTFMLFFYWLDFQFKILQSILIFWTQEMNYFSICWLWIFHQSKTITNIYVCLVPVEENIIFRFPSYQVIWKNFFPLFLALIDSRYHSATVFF